MEARKNIRMLTQEELTACFETMQQKKFHARQVWEWLWKKHAVTFAEMTNLGKELRQQLDDRFILPALSQEITQRSSDGTVKIRFRTHEGHAVEGVLIPTEDRQTACVSSQVGCSLSCRFCATGFLERKRNLHFDEIVDEVVLLQQAAEGSFGKKLSNIVFMGMGEPLLNYANVLRAIERITAADGLAMSPRRITVSTAGVAKMIRRLGDDGVRFNLALSLHAANDRKRNEIMPINETNQISELVSALNYFYGKTRNDITFEYILFRNVNDSLGDADDLIRICRQVPVRLVNIIEYNPIDQASFEKPDQEITQRFMDYLAAHRVNVRLRLSRGKDIDAACGQLANKVTA